MGPLGGLGIGEIVLIFIVVLLLFGAKRIPEIGSALGKGIREFKGSLREIEGEIKGSDEPRRTPPPSSQPREVAGTRPAEGGGTGEGGSGPEPGAQAGPEQPGTESAPGQDEPGGEPDGGQRSLTTSD